MKACSAVVHVSPALGARFTQYTAEFEVGGELGSAQAQRFVFVIQGKLELEAGGKSSELNSRGYAYIPEGLHHRITAKIVSRVASLKNVIGRSISESSTFDHFERRCDFIAPVGG